MAVKISTMQFSAVVALLRALTLLIYSRGPINELTISGKSIVEYIEGPIFFTIIDSFNYMLSCSQNTRHISDGPLSGADSQGLRYYDVDEMDFLGSHGSNITWNTPTGILH